MHKAGSHLRDHSCQQIYYVYEGLYILVRWPNGDLHVSLTASLSFHALHHQDDDDDEGEEEDDWEAPAISALFQPQKEGSGWLVAIQALSPNAQSAEYGHYIISFTKAEMSWGSGPLTWFNMNDCIEDGEKIWEGICIRWELRQVWRRWEQVGGNTWVCIVKGTIVKTIRLSCTRPNEAWNRATEFLFYSNHHLVTCDIHWRSLKIHRPSHRIPLVPRLLCPCFFSIWIESRLLDFPWRSRGRGGSEKLVSTAWWWDRPEEGSI